MQFNMHKNYIGIYNIIIFNVSLHNGNKIKEKENEEEKR